MRSLLSLLILLLASPAYGAVAATSLTSGGDATSTTVYTTASITPTANNLVLVAVASRRGTALEPTVTGNSLTYVKHAQIAFNGTARLLTVFRAMGASPTTGAITITFSATQDNASWSVIEFSGINTGGTNGSAACGTPGTNSTAGATSLDVTVGFTSGSNGTYSAFDIGTNEAMNPDGGAGWSEIHEVQVSDGGSSQTLQAQFNAGNDTTASSSWTSSVVAGGIGFEVIAASAGGSAAQVILVN